MTKKKSIEKLERIIVDLQRFWKNNSVPNMFIYGPNEDDVEYVINTLFNKEYGDSKKDMILNIDRSNAAYIGDDNIDIPAMEFCGTSFTVSDAVKPVINCSDIVLSCKGGEGAIRELADLIFDSK